MLEHLARARSAQSPGSRFAALLAHLQPTTAELADMMPELAGPNYLYRALPVLLKQGKVRCHTTTVDGQEGALEPGTDVEGQRHLLGVMPRWTLA